MAGYHYHAKRPPLCGFVQTRFLPGKFNKADTPRLYRPVCSGNSARCSGTSRRAVGSQRDGGGLRADGRQHD
jgi:hypothetical protein